VFGPLIGRTGPDWPAVTGTAGPHKERTGLDGPAGRHRIAGPLIERTGPDWPSVTGIARSDWPLHRANWP
jgi:hypothetical protein